ncbi:hypothetical protein B0H16DRAFT_1472992 [Mycena metata]|uniref:Uncharacterized protein n=1 Tax=Mycena metata TaxID=1033252 RepID=A0AAD7MLK0_9AGAR|nr:hypothetical protein B0H16DRAFT_1472992 [Mycena metata]
MATPPTQARLDNIKTWSTTAVDTLELLANAADLPILRPITITSRSLLNLVLSVNKNKCTEMMKQVYEIIQGIIRLHIQSESGQLPPSSLDHIAEFTKTLHKVHTFVEGQQKRNRFKQLLRHSEMSALLRDCTTELQHALNTFKIQGVSFLNNARQTQECENQVHQEVLDLVDSWSNEDSESSDKASTVLCGLRVCFDKSGLTILIGGHLGLKGSQDLTQALMCHFSGGPPCVVVLDNLETLWEQGQFQGEIEEFLSLLTEVEHLALIITMRGEERPAKVQWTRPFLQPLKPLTQHAALQPFTAITDDIHDTEDVDKVLLLTGNVPLVIDLVSHSVALDGCTNVLSRWEEEATSMISQGHDRKSNPSNEVCGSFTGPAKPIINAARRLSDADLQQSGLPIENVLTCKAALIRTSLGYRDNQKRLRVLMPIAQYMQRNHPPTADFLNPLLSHFQKLLKTYKTSETQGMVNRIIPNFANIRNLLLHGLKEANPDLVRTIEYTLVLSNLGRLTGCGKVSLMNYIPGLIPGLYSPILELRWLTECFDSYYIQPFPNPEAIISQGLVQISACTDPSVQESISIPVIWNFVLSCINISSSAVADKLPMALELSAGSVRHQSSTITGLAWICYDCGDYTAALKHARESQKLAQLAGALALESRVTRPPVDVEIFEVSRKNSAPAEMSKWLNLSRVTPPVDLNEIIQYYHIHNRINIYILSIDIDTDASRDIVLQNLGIIQGIFTEFKHLKQWERWWISIYAKFQLREGDFSLAEAGFQRCLKSSWGSDEENVTYCLEALADGYRWAGKARLIWATLFLVNSLKTKQKLQIHTALQFIAHFYVCLGDQQTALNLLTLALEGYTDMDVHRSKAECMLHIGEIWEQKGDFPKVLQLWEQAKPLFEQSSQIKQLALIDQRIHGIQPHLDADQQSLAKLSELHAPSRVATSSKDQDVGMEVANDPSLHSKKVLLAS